MAMKTALFLAEGLLGCTLAMKTALFLAEGLLGCTLAMKMAFFLAECCTTLEELPLGLRWAGCFEGSLVRVVLVGE